MENHGRRRQNQKEPATEKTASSLLLFKSSKVSTWFGQFTLLFLLAFHVVLVFSTHINVTSNFGDFPNICPTYLYSLRKSVLLTLRHIDGAVNHQHIGGC